MAESVQGRTRDEAHALFRGFEHMLQQGQASLDDAARAHLGSLNAFAELHEFRSRRRCAILPWSALLDALQPSGDS